MHQIDFEAGSLSMLRVRIREGSRFTVFDIDPGDGRRLGRRPAGLGTIAAPGART